MYKNIIRLKPMSLQFRSQTRPILITFHHQDDDGKNSSHSFRNCKFFYSLELKRKRQHETLNKIKVSEL